MKNLIDFIVDAAKDSKLHDEFRSHIADASLSDLVGWFNKKGYAVDEDDCKKISDNKEDLKSANVGFY